MSQTHTLAAYLVSNRWADIPDDVRHEARRSLLNYMGCAIGGSPHPAMDIAIRALSPFSGERDGERARAAPSGSTRCTRR